MNRCWAVQDARSALDRLVAGMAPVTSVSESVFERLAFGGRAEGLVVVVHQPSTALADLVVPRDALVLVIEGVEKPGNVGAVMRTADGAGVDAVIAASPTTDLFNPNAIRASAGTIFGLPLAAAPTSEVLAWLRAHGLRIADDQGRGPDPLFRRRPHRPRRGRHGRGSRRPHLGLGR